MRANRFGAPLGVAVLAALTVLLAAPALAAPAAASPTVASGSAPRWAYGGERNVWINVSGPNGTISIHSFAAVHVILTQTNTSATTFRLELERTMAMDFFANFCRPDCQNPMISGNLSMRAWDHGVAFANVTRSGTVFVNGTNATPAFALQDASSRSAANMTGRLWLNTSGMLGSHHATSYTTVRAQSSLAASFAPALGIVPIAPAPGETWNASSAFTSSGAFAVHYFWSHSTFNGTPMSGSGNQSGSASGTGNVTLVGADLGAVVLKDGRSVPAIVYHLEGPSFSLREGMILVPGAADLYAGSEDHGGWESQSPAFGGFATDRVDLDPGFGGGHFGLLASASAVSPQSAAPIGGQMQGSRDMIAGPSAQSTVNLPGGTELQAQPESLSQAQQGSQCALASCPSGTSAGHVPVFLIGLGVAAVAAIALIALVAARRRAPKPPTGATAVYPAGASMGPATATPPAPSRNGPGADAKETNGSDPLGHLW